MCSAALLSVFFTGVFAAPPGAHGVPEAKALKSKHPFAGWHRSCFDMIAQAKCNCARWHNQEQTQDLDARRTIITKTTRSRSNY